MYECSRKLRPSQCGHYKCKIDDSRFNNLAQKETKQNCDKNAKRENKLSEDTFLLKLKRAYKSTENAFLQRCMRAVDRCEKTYGIPPMPPIVEKIEALDLIHAEYATFWENIAPLKSTTVRKRVVKSCQPVPYCVAPYPRYTKYKTMKNYNNIDKEETCPDVYLDSSSEDNELHWD